MEIRIINDGFQLTAVTIIPAPLEQVFDFFSRAENLQQITPPWLNFRFVTAPPSEVHAGTRIEYALRVRLLPLHWLTEISVWDPPRRFVDAQLKGPYRMWVHEHRFEPLGEHTRMTDTVHYQLPFGLLGRMAHLLFVRRDIEEIFRYREEQIKMIFG